MKKLSFLISIAVFTLIGSSAFSQKYKTAADTVNLNKEYLKVTNVIADLTSKLAIAQNNLPGYNSKATAATSDAQNTALASSDQASKATNGSVKEAKRAKRRAKKALKEAKDADRANDNLSDQNKKIAKLNTELAKKQARLQELDAMRTTIMSTSTTTTQ